MTNEEALIHGQEDKPKDLYMEGWNAAIDYMQEQNKSAEQSEPVATIYNGNAYWIGKEPPEGTNLFTTPQKDITSISGAATLRQLKRLSDDQIKSALLRVDDKAVRLPDGFKAFANAIMDEMERINK